MPVPSVYASPYQLGEKNPNVSGTHVEYGAALPSWTTMRDIRSQKHVHDAGSLYLPMLSDQTSPQYEAYKLRGSFPLFTEHVLRTFVGMALRKDIMTTNVPEDFQVNVDGTGTTLTAYTKDLLQKFLGFGRCITIIEYATNAKRPKLLLYDHLSLINWKTRIVNEKSVLSLVVLKEMVDDPDNLDEFTTNLVPRYRVLSLDKGTNYYRQRVYDQLGVLKSDIVPTKDRKPLTSIPAVIHGGTDIKKPPLLSIAEQNLAWYRLDCDYKHGLHYVALPTPVVTGVDPDDEHAPKSIGATKIWFLSENAKASMLEFSGAGLSAVAGAKIETSENIITLSSRILSPPRNMNETATAASIRNAGETASLADTVNMLSRELGLVLEFALNWDNIVDNIHVQINTDFIPTILSGGDAASYGSMQNKGTLSRKSLFRILKQGEIHKGDRTFEEEEADIKKELQERDDREVELAKRLAEIAAVSKEAASEEGKTNGEGDPLNPPQQGKSKEQSNKKPETK